MQERLAGLEQKLLSTDSMVVAVQREVKGLQDEAEDIGKNIKIRDIHLIGQRIRPL